MNAFLKFHACNIYIYIYIKLVQIKPYVLSVKKKLGLYLWIRDVYRAFVIGNIKYTLSGHVTNCLTGTAQGAQSALYWLSSISSCEPLEAFSCGCLNIFLSTQFCGVWCGGINTKYHYKKNSISATCMTCTKITGCNSYCVPSMHNYKPLPRIIETWKAQTGIEKHLSVNSFRKQAHSQTA